MFGEAPPERRERLKNLVSLLSDDEIARKLRKKEEQEKREEESQNVCFSLKEIRKEIFRKNYENMIKEVTWYHEGSEEMLYARLWTAEYSLKRAKARIAAQRATLQIPDIDKTAKLQESYRNIRV